MYGVRLGILGSPRLIQNATKPHQDLDHLLEQNGRMVA